MSFTYGVGSDHSIFDVYIGGTLWQSYDGYADSSDEVTQTFELSGDGPYLFEVRNRAEKNSSSSGYKMRFKQLVLVDITYDLRTIDYTYDRISRLVEADYNNGAEIVTYGFDLAGNLTNLDGTLRTYNAANQLIHDGTNSLTYDSNGNLWKTNDVETHVWDRANRLLSFGGIDYAYNGDGNRISQDALKYLLDLQPGLAVVLGDSDGNRYVYSPRGIHAVNDGSAWTYPVTDALGSVRGYADVANTVLSNVNYGEYGVPDTSIIGPAFTGEWRDETEVQYHRKRYLNPGLGVWLSLDPFEGMMNRPMSLNGYSWVEGNTPNTRDASGQNSCAVFQEAWKYTSLYSDYVQRVQQNTINTDELCHFDRVGITIPSKFFQDPDIITIMLAQHMRECDRVSINGHVVEDYGARLWHFEYEVRRFLNGDDVNKIYNPCDLDSRCPTLYALINGSFYSTNDNVMIRQALESCWPIRTRRHGVITRDYPIYLDLAALIQGPGFCSKLKLEDVFALVLDALSLYAFNPADVADCAFSITTTVLDAANSGSNVSQDDLEKRLENAIGSVAACGAAIPSPSQKIAAATDLSLDIWTALRACFS